MKNKIKTIQEQYGGEANFLLLLEDNFSDVSSHGGRKTTMNRKILVTAGGDLKEAFIKSEITYDPEKMFMLKKGKALA